MIFAHMLIIFTTEMSDGMKIQLALLLVCVFLISLFAGCATDSGVTILEDVHIAYHNNSTESLLFKDMETFQDYLYKIQAENSAEEINSQLSRYDEAYFEGNMLALVYYVDSTSSSEISVKSVKCCGSSVEVVVNRRTGSSNTNALKSYLILVEMTQDESCSEVTLETKTIQLFPW